VPTDGGGTGTGCDSVLHQGLAAPRSEFEVYSAIRTYAAEDS